MDLTIKAILVLMIAFFVQYGWQIYKLYTMPEPIFDDMQTDEDLTDLTKEFNQPETIKVAEGIHIAIGFAIANSIMIEAPDGLIIVDTTEAIKTAQAIRKEFRKISPTKPIKALMYTHNHADHTFGAKAFVEDPKNMPEVWAHEKLPEELKRVVTTAPTVFKRAMRQFGTMLHNITNAGIGIALHYDKTDQTSGLILPTYLFKGKEAEVTIAGLKMKLFHIPGETNDHMGIWLEDQRIFFCGDDIYKAFPNLYAIRGTPSRNTLLWVQSLDLIRELNPKILIPSHTRPIIGEKNIQDTLTIYRDAIQLVHDQTVRWMNRGYYPNDIVKKLQFPPQLKNHPYLREFYGTIEWSSKGIFEGYMGWFSGDPLELSPLTFGEKATKMLELVGETSVLVKHAQKALEKSEHQWALELSSYVLHFEPTHYAAAKIRLDALVALGNKQTSANGKNYYWTAALEYSGKVKLEFYAGNSIETISLEVLFAAMSTHVIVETCGNKDLIGTFKFSDFKKNYNVHMRNGILELLPRAPRNREPDFILKTSTKVWREILAQKASSIMAIASGDIEIEKGMLVLKEFMDCIEKNI